MRFAIVGEGLTDFKVLKNLLIGFFKDKNLPVTKLRPKDIEPFGWGNVLNYISTEEFQDEVDATNYVIIQIDTDKCEEWKEELTHIGDDETKVNDFINQIIKVLIKRIGNPFYTTNKGKILFAICVHDIECWLLPFNSTTKSHFTKIVGCVNAIEHLANKKGFSIHEKNYEDGAHYDNLSKEMRDNRELLKKSELNPSLKVFVNTLSSTFTTV